MKNRGGFALLKGILISLVVLAVFAAGIFIADKKLDSERLENLQKAIVRSAVSCYAIEGFYPPDIAYLENNYGIIIDRENYTVYYEAYASNIMPDITVLKNW